MRKIGLFLDTQPANGGVFQYNLSILDAVAALPPDRYQAVIAYTAPHWQEHLSRYPVRAIFVNYHFTARVTGILLNLMRIPLPLWHRLAPLLQRHARQLIGERCDLWLFPSQDSVSYQLPLPSLTTILDLAHRYVKRFPESASSYEYLLRERGFANLCRWAKGVLVDSETGRRQVMESYGLPRERVHPLPYVAPFYMHAASLQPDFAVRYHLPEKFLFYPAQFWEHKNHRNLLKAFASLKKDLPDLKLVLAGAKKNAYDAVIALVRELNLTDDVQFLGYVPNEDMSELYRLARALVMPTYFGPTNIPPLEASVVGCPVAISGVSAMQDQLGDSVLVFDPDSVEEIAGCIRRLWTDDRLCADMSAAGRERMAAWGQAAFNTRLTEIIDQLFEDRPELRP